MAPWLRTTGERRQIDWTISSQARRCENKNKNDDRKDRGAQQQAGVPRVGRINKDGGMGMGRGGTPGWIHKGDGDQIKGFRKHLL